MTRATPAGWGLLFCVLLPACSRGRVLDDGPIASATGGGIPAAASAAYIASPGGDGTAAAGTTAPSRVPVDPLAPPLGSRGPRPMMPRIHDDGASLVPAGLPVEVVRRIVRQNFGRFRLCYESGLRTDPTIEGTVRTRFVIEADGEVGTVSDAGSGLADKGVLACVERAFAGLSFPQPSSGAMTVTYSLSFTAPP